MELHRARLSTLAEHGVPHQREGSVLSMGPFSLFRQTEGGDGDGDGDEADQGRAPSRRLSPDRVVPDKLSSACRAGDGVR